MTGIVHNNPVAGLCTAQKLWKFTTYDADSGLVVWQIYNLPGRHSFILKHLNKSSIAAIVLRKRAKASLSFHSRTPTTNAQVFEGCHEGLECASLINPLSKQKAKKALLQGTGDRS